MTVKAVVLGAGLVGVDLMERMVDVPDLDCALVVGRNPRSAGLRRASELGCATSSGGVDAVVERLETAEGERLVVFDTSDAATHGELSARLRVLRREMGCRATVIDLTPSKLGLPVVPSVNPEVAESASDNSLISCAAQASIPVLHALARRYPARYVELVTTAASASAGPATRRNLDEFLAATSAAVGRFTGSPRVKMLGNISPARPGPPFRVVMRLLAAGMVPDEVCGLVDAVALVMEANAPGYSVRSCTVQGELATVVVQVVPSTPRLPGYLGNLEIISAAALAVARDLASTGALVTGGAR